MTESVGMPSWPGGKSVVTSFIDDVICRLYAPACCGETRHHRGGPPLFGYPDYTNVYLSRRLLRLVGDRLTAANMRWRQCGGWPLCAVPVQYVPKATRMSKKQEWDGFTIHVTLTMGQIPAAIPAWRVLDW